MAFPPRLCSARAGWYLPAVRAPIVVIILWQLCGTVAAQDASPADANPAPSAAGPTEQERQALPATTPAATPTAAPPPQDSSAVPATLGSPEATHDVATAVAVDRVAERPLEPGEMTHEEVVAYFRDRRAWRRTRYDRPITLGLHSGYGWVASDEPINPYRIGLGGTVGYTFPIHNTYLGASFTYFTGNSIGAANDDELAAGTYSSIRTSLDLGYEFIFRYVRMRPLLYGGATILSAPSAKKVFPAFGLGAGALVPLSMLYVGVELRFDIIASNSDSGVDSATWLGTLGVRF